MGLNSAVYTCDGCQKPYYHKTPTLDKTTSVMKAYAFTDLELSDYTPEDYDICSQECWEKLIIDFFDEDKESSKVE